MAQEWNLRHVLIDKQGNFGSIAGLPPAAMRYCVTGDTLVRTLNGTRRIADLAPAEPNSETDLFQEVFDRNGRPVVASKLFHSGDHPTYRSADGRGIWTCRHGQPPGPLPGERGGIADAGLAPSRRNQLRAPASCWRWTAPEEALRPRRTRPDAGRADGAWMAEGFASEHRAGFNNTDKAYFDEVLRSYDAIVGGRRYLTERRHQVRLAPIRDRHSKFDRLRGQPARRNDRLPQRRQACPGLYLARSLAVKRVLLAGACSREMAPRRLLPRLPSASVTQPVAGGWPRTCRCSCWNSASSPGWRTTTTAKSKSTSATAATAASFSEVGFLGVKQAKLPAELDGHPANQPRPFRATSCLSWRNISGTRAAAATPAAIGCNGTTSTASNAGSATAKLILAKIESDQVKAVGRAVGPRRLLLRRSDRGRAGRGPACLLHPG